MLRDADIAIAGNLCIGMPHETRESYQQTKEFVQVYKNTMWFNIYGFVPYPNTPLYAELVKNNRINHYDFDKWCEGAPFVFEPYTMSSSEAYDWLVDITDSAS